MDLLNTLSGIDVVIHAEPAEWWQVTAAFTPLATLLLLVLLVLASCRSTTAATARSNRRAESWSRAQWAMEMAMDDKPQRRKVGLAVLDQLHSDPLVGNAANAG